MRETPGFTAPIYQSLTQPQLLAGVSRTFFICDLVAMILVGLWTLAVPGLWPGLLIGVALYVVAWCGTKYDTEFFEIVIAHVQQQDHYEG